MEQGGGTKAKTESNGNWSKVGGLKALRLSGARWGDSKLRQSLS